MGTRVGVGRELGAGAAARDFADAVFPIVGVAKMRMLGLVGSRAVIGVWRN